MSADITVTDNPAAGRLEVRLEGEVAFAEYRRTAEGMVFPHTVVPPALEGRGIGGALVREGLRMAKAEGLLVIPKCSFFAGYIARHPEFEDQVHPRYRDRVEAARKA